MPCRAVLQYEYLALLDLITKGHPNAKQKVRGAQALPPGWEARVRTSLEAGAEKKKRGQ